MDLLAPPVSPPAKRHKSQRKSTDRRRAPHISKTSGVGIDENGELYDAVHGGPLPSCKSRAQSKKPSLHAPLMNFYDEERAGVYNIDNLKPQLDEAFVAEQLADAGRHVQMKVQTIDWTTLTWLFDFGMYQQGLPLRCNGDMFVALNNLDKLVGQVLPINGKLASGTKRLAASELGNLADMGPGHAFALHPVFISATAPGVNNDSGAILLQGVVVSQKAFNYPLDHELRIRTGLPCGDAFDDTWALVLITDTYRLRKEDGSGVVQTFPGMPFCALAMPRCSGGEASKFSYGRNLFDKTYRWCALLQRHKLNPGSSLKFALHEIKQVKSMFRSVMAPAVSIRHAMDLIATLRQTNSLDSVLDAKEPTMVSAKPDRKELHDLCGNDLRKMLLVEQLLLSTPLEFIATGSVSLGLPINVPAELRQPGAVFSKLREFVRTATVHIPSVSYQAMYDAWAQDIEA